MSTVYEAPRSWSDTFRALLAQAEAHRGSITLPDPCHPVQFPRTTGQDVHEIVPIFDDAVRTHASPLLLQWWLADRALLARQRSWTLADPYVGNRSFWNTLAHVAIELDRVAASPPDGEHLARVMNQLAAPSGPLRDTAGATLITLFTAETWSEMADRQRQLFRLLRGEDRDHYPRAPIVPCTCNADVLELAAYWTEQLARIGRDPLDTEARLVHARWPEVVDRVVEFAKHGHPRATYAHNVEFWTALAVLVGGDAGSERPAPWAFDGPPSADIEVRNAAADDATGATSTAVPSNLSDLLSRVVDRITAAGKRAVSEALVKPMLYAGGAIAGGLLLYLLLRSPRRCEGRS